MPRYPENGTVHLKTSDMDYVSFGRGKQILIMLPGLGDGLSTVKGTALAFAAAYRIYARAYTVYVFSRKNQLPQGCTTREMAGDQAEAMYALGLAKAHVLGISQGGMIAQYLAADFPDLVDRLILAVTVSRPNESLKAAVSRWIDLARQENFRELMIDTAEMSYSPRYLKKYRRLYPVLTKMGRGKDFSRFLIQADSCLTHDACDKLQQIACPTLVIGGGKDRIAGPDSAAELAARIRDSRLHIYPELGHAAYEEAPDFNRKILDFLSESGGV